MTGKEPEGIWGDESDRYLIWVLVTQMCIHLSKLFNWNTKDLHISFYINYVSGVKKNFFKRERSDVSYIKIANVVTCPSLNQSQAREGIICLSRPEFSLCPWSLGM